MKFLISVAIIWASFHFGGLMIGGIVTAIIFIFGFIAAIKQVYSPWVKDAKTGEIYHIAEFQNKVLNEPGFSNNRINPGWGVILFATLFINQFKLDLDEFDNRFMNMIQARLVLSRKI